MVLDVEAESKLECRRLHYNTKFVNADVEEGVYVKMEPGYKEFNGYKVPIVLRLLTSVHGLRRNPSNWWGI